MSDTKAELYFHFVWGTKGGLPWITCGVRRRLHNCIVDQATQMGCKALAIGGVDDHVHLVVKAPTNITPAQVAKHVKAVSSLFAKEQLGRPGFYWQTGYGVFSLSRSHLQNVMKYVARQEEHHNGGKTHCAWEPPPEYDVSLPSRVPEGCSSP